MSAGSTPLILCIEDHAASLAMLARVLARAGYRTAQAETVDSALEAARASRPDLLVLDLHLEELGGAELVNVITCAPETSGIPIVLVSGAGDPASAASLAVVELLLKPWTPAQMAAAVESAFSGRELAR